MPATQWTHATIMEQLPAIIADCLGVDESDVLPHSNFKSDLGGESIDELDLSFRCEKAFQVKGPFQPLVQLGHASLDNDGCIPLDVLQEFLRQFPFLATLVADSGRTRFQPRQLMEFFTTDAIAHFVEAAIKRNGGSITL
ncbi:MAG: phosphopantetheine-binding protein [Planctomycetaceae bacterium]|nr:phosphopantetheine-binding protein [Planctomycetaceae bacterium]